jgi:hypothetical protein
MLRGKNYAVKIVLRLTDTQADSHRENVHESINCWVND